MLVECLLLNRIRYLLYHLNFFFFIHAHFLNFVHYLIIMTPLSSCCCDLTDLSVEKKKKTGLRIFDSGEITLFIYLFIYFKKENIVGGVGKILNSEAYADSE